MIAVLAVGLLIGVGVWYVITQRDVVSPEPTPAVTPTPSEIAIDTSDWKTYTNDELGVSFTYPPQVELISEFPDLKMILDGPEQFDSPGFLDGLFIMMSESTAENGETPADYLFNEIENTYSEASRNQLSVDNKNGREFAIYRFQPVLDEFSHSVSVAIESDNNSILNFIFSIGRNDRSYYDSIRNSIIDSIEFVE